MFHWLFKWWIHRDSVLMCVVNNTSEIEEKPHGIAQFSHLYRCPYCGYEVRMNTYKVAE